MNFVQARHYRAGGNIPVGRIVIHTMEAPEKGSTAEDVARYFATTDRVASAHFCIDADSIVQCVREQDTAFHAPPNQGSIGLEHAGYSRQSAAEWADAYSQAMLRRSAALCRELCDRYGVPKAWIGVDDLRAGKHGVTSHNNVSLAFGQSTHTDPGPYFPMAQYMAWVREEGDHVGVRVVTKRGSKTGAFYAVLGVGETTQFLARLSPDDWANLGSPTPEVLEPGDLLLKAVHVGGFDPD